MKSVRPRFNKNRKGLKQGYFPVDKSIKYIGPRPCIYRSSYEWHFMVYCENSSVIKHWSSEPFGIDYKGPTGKLHKYYIDFTLQMTNGETWLIEVKPYSQTVPQHTPQYRQNAAKWQAAKAYAAERGYKFSIITEQHSALKGKV